MVHMITRWRLMKNDPIERTTNISHIRHQIIHTHCCSHNRHVCLQISFLSLSFLAVLHSFLQPRLVSWRQRSAQCCCLLPPVNYSAAGGPNTARWLT